MPVGPLREPWLCVTKPRVAEESFNTLRFGTAFEFIEDSVSTLDTPGLVWFPFPGPFIWRRRRFHPSLTIRESEVDGVGQGVQDVVMNTMREGEELEFEVRHVPNEDDLARGEVGLKGFDTGFFRSTTRPSNQLERDIHGVARTEELDGVLVSALEANILKPKDGGFPDLGEFVHLMDEFVGEHTASFGKEDVDIVARVGTTRGNTNPSKACEVCCLLLRDSGVTAKHFVEANRHRVGFPDPFRFEDLFFIRDWVEAIEAGVDVRALLVHDASKFKAGEPFREDRAADKVFVVLVDDLFNVCEVLGREAEVVIVGFGLDDVIEEVEVGPTGANDPVAANCWLHKQGLRALVLPNDFGHLGFRVCFIFIYQVIV